MFRKKKAEEQDASKESEIQEEATGEIEEQVKLEKQDVGISGEVNASEVLNNLKEFSRMLPRLNDRKEQLEKHIHQVQQKISEVEDLILKLGEKKGNLKEEIGKSQEELSKIDEIKMVLQRIVGENAAPVTAV